jgi:hypothetical protein
MWPSFQRARRGLHLFVACLVAISVVLPSPHLALSQNECEPRHCVWLPLVTNPEPVYIRSSSYAKVLGAMLAVEGELATFGSPPVYNVLLEARLLNGEGTLVQTLPITPLLDMTSPTSTNPFFLAAPVCCNATKAELRILSWQDSSPRSYVTLAVTIIDWTSGGFTVSVHNDNPSPVHNVVVVVRNTAINIYTKRYTVIASNETVVYDDPSAGDSFGLRFQAWAQGQRAQ